MHPPAFGAVLVGGIFLSTFTYIRAQNDNLIKPVGPKMCGQLCKQTVGCLSVIYMPFYLLCEKQDQPGQVSDTLNTYQLHIFMARDWVDDKNMNCSKGTRMFRNRKGQMKCKLVAEKASPVSQADMTTERPCSTDLQSDEYNPNITLRQACVEGKLNIVKYIICNGLADINSVGYCGRTPVMAAARYGQLAVFDFLIQQGCDLSVLDNETNNILHIASKWGNIDIVKKLIKQPDVSIEGRDIYGRTPVMIGAITGHVGVVKLLVNKGCDVSSRDHRGNNVLHAACLHGHLNVIEYLLSLKAAEEMRKMKNKRGKAPVQMAKGAKRGAMVALFKKEKSA